MEENGWICIAERGWMENDRNKAEKGVHIYQLDRVHLGVVAVCLVLIY